MIKAGDASGDETMWNYRFVRSVTLTPRASSHNDLAHLIERVAQRVERIVVTSSNVEDTRDPDGIDIPLLPLLTNPGVSHLSFPSLTHAQFGRYSLKSLLIIPLLCEASPNLITLEFTSLPNDSDRHNPNAPNQAVLIPPGFTKPTKIVQLRIPFGYDGFCQPPPSDLGIITKLLENCPRLEKFAMPNADLGRLDTGPRFLADLDYMRNLSDLDWGCSKIRDGEDVGPHSVLHKLKSLRFRAKFYDHPLPGLSYLNEKYPNDTRLPRLSGLETLSFDLSLRGRIPPDDLSIGRSAQEAKGLFTWIPFNEEVILINPELVIWVSQSPKLRHIHFDDSRFDGPIPDPNRQPAGIIRSIISSSGAELLHLRLHAHDLDLEPVTGSPPIPTRRFLSTHARELVANIRNIKSVSLPFYQDFTCYQGHVVPLSVLEEVKRVEGVEDEVYWDRRGVEVGDEAWEVINTWRAGLD